MAIEKMEIMLPQSNKVEAAEVMEFLDVMSQNEQKEMLAFLRGVQFGKSLSMHHDDRAAG